MSGEIPSELGDLGNLRTLELDGNDLSGEIPSELGGLSNLVRLNLVGNDLSGCLPASLRDHLNTRLRELAFCGDAGVGTDK